MAILNRSMTNQYAILQEMLRQSQSASKEHYLSNVQSCDEKNPQQFGMWLDEVSWLATICDKNPMEVALAISKGTLQIHQSVGTNSANIILASNFTEGIQNPPMKNKLRSYQVKNVKDILGHTIQADQKQKNRALDFGLSPKPDPLLSCTVNAIQGKGCFKCGSKDHFIKDCPLSQQDNMIPNCNYTNHRYDTKYNSMTDKFLEPLTKLFTDLVAQLKLLTPSGLNFHSSSSQKEEKNHDAFTEDERQIGTTPLIKMSIDTRDQSVIAKKPYPVALKHYDWVRDDIDKLLEAGVIRESHPSWSAPIVVVPKGDGGRRLCMDFKDLNAITRTYVWPMPRVKDIFAKLGKAKFFTTLDLRSGCHYIVLEADAIKKTAFVMPLGKNE